MSRKLTIDIDHIDPRVGDTFGFDVTNNGIYLGFTGGTGWDKTFVSDGDGQLDMFYITKFNSDLTLDNIYGSFNGDVLDTAVQTDGKLICVGDFDSYDGNYCPGICRINTDGSFNSIPNITTGPNAVVRTIALGSGNEIYIGGDFTSVNGTSVNRICRLNTNGTVNTTFVTNVMSSVTSKGFNNSVNIIYYYIGGFYVGGKFTNFNGNSRNRIIRLNTDGTIDASFVVGDGFSIDFGKEVNTIIVKEENGCFGYTIQNGSGGTDFIETTYVTCDGFGGGVDIYVPGQSTTVCSLTIPVIGSVIGMGSVTATGLACSSPRLIIGGSFNKWQGTTNCNNIVKLRLSGLLDTEFNQGSSGTGTNGTVHSIILDDDDIIIGGEFTHYAGVARAGIVKFNLNGDIINIFDDGFNMGGSVNTLLYNGSSLVVAGSMIGYNGVVCGNIVTLNGSGDIVNEKRLNATIEEINLTSSDITAVGRFTQITATGGSSSSSFLTIPLAEDIVVDFGTGTGQSVMNVYKYDNKFTLVTGGGGGYGEYDGVPAEGLITIDNSGALVVGITGSTLLNSNDIYKVNTMLPDGSFIIIGYSGNTIDGIGLTVSGRILKFNNDLTQDTSFNSGESGFTGTGFVVNYIVNNVYDVYVDVFIPIDDCEYNGVPISQQSTVVIDGNTGDYITQLVKPSTYNAVTVVNMETCDNDDLIYYSSSGNSWRRVGLISLISDISVMCVRELSNGNLVILGNWGTALDLEYSVSNIRTVAILTEDGSFVSGNVGTGFGTFGSSPIKQIWVDNEDRIYITRCNTTYNGVAVASTQMVIRLNSDLTWDTSFVINCNSTIRDMHFDTNGIMVVGTFDTFNSASRNSINYIDYNGANITTVTNLPQTIQNTYDNLVEFNSGVGITYSIVGNSVVMEYIFDDEEIVVEDVYDTPNHVEITVDNESITINELIDEIVTKSNHEIITTETYPFEFTNFKIRMYEGGLFSGVTGSVAFNFNKPKVSPDQTNIYIEISDLIRSDFEWDPIDFITPDFSISKNLPENVSKWVYVEETNYQTGATVSLNLHYMFAIDGYLYNREEQHVPNLLVSSRKRYLHLDQTQRIYFQVNFLNNILVQYSSGLSFIPTFNINIDLDNKKYVQSLQVVTRPNERWVDYIFEYDGNSLQDPVTEVIRYYFYNGCMSNGSNQIIFKNKWGVLESLMVNKRRKDSISVESKDFTRSIVDFNGDYNTRRHTKTNFNIMVEESFSVNTDALPEYMNDVMYNLYESRDEVWLYDGDEFIPVLIDGDFEEIHRTDDIVQYTIKLKGSHKKIKNFK